MYGSVAANKRNTVFIMAAFIGIIAAIGWVVSWYYGNTTIAYWVIGAAFVYAVIQYFMASKLATAVTGAKQIEKKDNPELFRIVENLAITDGLPMPKVYIMNDASPNAFATGRDPDHAIVAVTTGLLEIMDKNELEGVISHELGHVKNYDIRVSMIAFGLVSAIAILSDIALRMFFFGGGRRSENGGGNPVILIVGIVLIVLAPIMAALIQMAVSRQREYLADATGAMTTRYPDGLVSALEKLKDHGRPMKKQSHATSHMFFSNPLKKGFMSNLFSTHPPLDERIERLKDNAGKF